MDATLNTAKKESQLQKLLTEERIKAEQYKVNYQILKAKNTKLEDEVHLLKVRLEALQLENEKESADNAQLMSDLEKQLMEAKSAFQMLQTHILSQRRTTYQKPMRMHGKDASEMENTGNYQENLTRAEDEVLRWREEYVTAVSKFASLQSQSENTIFELKKQVKDCKSQTENEIVQLKKRNNTVEKTLSEQMEIIRVLEKENVHLKQKVNVLNQETNDLRENSLKERLEYDNHYKSCNNSIKGLNAKLKSQEIEKSALKDEQSKFMDIINQNQEQVSKLKVELAEKKCHANRLQLQVNELEQKLKMESIEYQMEIQRDKVEWEKEIKQLTKEMVLKLEVVEKNKLQQAENTELQAIIEQLRQEKLAVEKELIWKAKRVKEREDELLCLQKELSEMKEINHNKETECRQLTEKLKTEMKALNEAEEGLMMRNKKLNSALRSARKQIKEKYGKTESLSKLKQKNTQLFKKLQSTIRTYKQKVKKYRHLIIKLRNKMEILKAQMQTMTIEKESLKCGVPQEVHQMLKKEYDQLKKRNREFNKILYLQGVNQNLMSNIN